MNPITDIIFSLTWVVLFVFAIRSIVKGWSIAREDTARPNGIWTTKVTKVQHPEMVDVKPGEELMGVTFKQREEDPLQQSLQARIQTLRDEEGTTEIEEDDDDDGDIIVRV